MKRDMCGGGIGRHVCDEAHYAEHVTIDKRLRLVMQGANLCPHTTIPRKEETLYECCSYDAY